MTRPVSYPEAVQELMAAWQQYLKVTDWQVLIEGVQPEQSGCGRLYELPNVLDRPNEGFAIADMRELVVAEPHFHPDDAYEVYFVLQGTATVVIGGKPHSVARGAVLVIPPDTAHFTIPDQDFVIAVVNTPPFSPERYIVVRDTDTSVDFDAEQFARLSAR